MPTARYVKIIDYKSGNKTFHFQDIYYGLQLQLLVYLDAYLKYYKKTGASFKPGGIFYFRITDPTLALDEELSARQSKKFSMKNAHVGTAFAERMSYPWQTIALQKAAVPPSCLSAIPKKATLPPPQIATEEQYAAKFLDFVATRTQKSAMP